MAIVKFNNVWLEDLVPHIRLDDIDVSPISYNAIASDRPVTFGREFVRNVGTTRTVTITFALQIDDREERENQLQTIREWARTDKEYTLVLPHFSNRHLECVCTEHPDASYRQWWQNRMRLVFTCFNNPFWTSDDVQQTPCGQSFTVGGSAPPLMTIERRLLSAVSNQYYISGNQVMQFSQIPAGNLVIDLNRQTAAVSGASIMQYFRPTGTFIEPVIGANQLITGSGTIKVRERWV